MKKILSVVFVVSILLISSYLVASDQLVTNNNDTGSGSLRQAIADVGEGETITFDDDYTITLSSSLLSIDKSVTITGTGIDQTIIQAHADSGSATHGVFSITSGTVTLENMTIRHGVAVSGAGIYNASNDLTIANCRFTDNLATDDAYAAGGAIVNILCSSTIINCEFYENTALFGGAIFNYTASGYTTNPQISGCTFTNNNASSSGGALCNMAQGGICSPALTNCSFMENTADNSAGSIYNFANGGTCNASYSQCTIRGNSTLGNGGGVANSSGSGGTSNPQFINCLIAGNTSSVKGGGISNYSYGNSSVCDPVIFNCTISGNYSSEAGGGISDEGVELGDCEPTITNTIIWNNYAVTSNSEIYNSEAEPTFSYCDIEDSGGSSSWDSSFGTDGGNNIDNDPLFVLSLDPSSAPSTSGNFHLSDGSPCLSTATSSGAPEEDLDGRSRPLGSGYDMGCYEEYDDGTLPVVLSTFTAQYIKNTPTIYWITQSETDNMGWFLYRNNENNFATADVISDMIEGWGTSTEQHRYIYEDNIQYPEVDDTYYYWLESIDYGGVVHHYDNAAILNIVNNNSGNSGIVEPERFGLLNNEPNPVISSTRIAFNLTEAAQVDLSVYNTKGQRVRHLYYGNTSKHTVMWDGKDNNGNELKNGIYFYQLSVNEKTRDIKKLIIMK